MEYQKINYIISREMIRLDLRMKVISNPEQSNNPKYK